MTPLNRSHKPFYQWRTALTYPAIFFQIRSIYWWTSSKLFFTVSS